MGYMIDGDFSLTMSFGETEVTLPIRKFIICKF